MAEFENTSSWLKIVQIRPGWLCGIFLLSIVSCGLTIAFCGQIIQVNSQGLQYQFGNSKYHVSVLNYECHLQ